MLNPCFAISEVSPALSPPVQAVREQAAEQEHVLQKEAAGNSRNHDGVRDPAEDRGAPEAAPRGHPAAVGNWAVLSLAPAHRDAAGGVQWVPPSAPLLKEPLGVKGICVCPLWAAGLGVH